MKKNDSVHMFQILNINLNSEYKLIAKFWKIYILSLSTNLHVHFTEIPDHLSSIIECLCALIKGVIMFFLVALYVQDCARHCTDLHTTWMYSIAQEIAQTFIQHDCTGLRERLHRLTYNMTLQDCARDCTDYHTTWLYRIAREIAQ